MQTISVSCKLQVPVELRQDLDRTLQGFADACNQILEVAKTEKVKNTTKLHHLTYYLVRAETGLKANHVCQAIRRVVGALNGQKQVHKFRPTSINLDVRTFSYRESDQYVGVTLMSGRVWLPLSIGNYQLALLRGQSPTAATLVKHRNGDYYIQIQIDLPTAPAGKTPRVIGVDLGRRDIAHTSTGKSWDGKQTNRARNNFAKVRASAQSKRTKGAKKLLKRLSGKEQRFQKWVNHTISRQLADYSQQMGAALAFEDLTGIRQRAKARGREQRRRHHNWAFYRLRQFVTYKVAIAGIPMLLIHPAYTSKTCHHCLDIGKRDAKSFKCENCGWHGDADFNAANVISLVRMSVTHPERSIISCVLRGCG